MSDQADLLVGSFPFVPKQERAQQKRNALLNSGRTLFILKGYEQTTAKEIASHAGVAVGTFYRYFSDKRQLLLALLEDQLDKLLPPEPSWLAHDPELLLTTMLEKHFERLNQLGIHRVLTELIMKDSELAEVFRTAKRKIHAKILAGLIKAFDHGLTWRDLDLETVTWSLIVLVENVQEKECQSGIPANYQEIAKVICRMVFPPQVIIELKTKNITNI
ncbi:TetR/AcrR family transcriptional regulator [Bacillus sp. BRMEA1]|uniref:TetR/AcrR family transcriptional regulator n=1 Tax=Neobacillus endophyticus TaxID=2738405 RepID=UPI0015640C25|nr:TetR/AcrR family transcriptional regulator [Neobacillus endophyticus]NRD79431.1 TetR/AcrR family transcriptional regulator [Neobacillus endophyticus]